MAERAKIIADAVTQAIMSQALPPGTKLGERDLAEACATSRAVIKQALLILAQSLLVENRPNAGAFVAQLTIQDAYDLFDALTILEQGVVRQLISRLSSREWDVVNEHVELTQSYIDSGDDDEADKVGPEFHSLLVSLLHNKAINELHLRLVRKSSLLKALYINRQYHRCRLNDEHGELVALMRTGQTEKAVTLIADHYRDIVRGFDMDGSIPQARDLKSALAPFLKFEPS